MSLEHYWAALLKQWKLIVICFVVVGSGAYIGSKLLIPMYRSTVVVQVAVSLGNSSADYNSLLASDQLVQTEAQLAVSNPVLQEVASRYPGLTFVELSKEVSSSPELGTQLFEIDVLDSSPSRAAALANDIAITLINKQDQVAQQENIQSQQQIQQDLQQTQRQIDTITGQLTTLQAHKGSSVQISVLQAQLSALQQHYSQWQSLLAQLELTQVQNSNFLRVVQPAQPTVSPVSPNVPLYTAGGLAAGLFLGLLLALLFDQLDTRVRTPEELAKVLGWPVLASIWRVHSSKREDVVNPKGGDANVEAYRILRTNIGFSHLDKPLHSLMVTSAMPREGKSIAAANLAIFMAKAGKRTILIDADLRRPTLHTLFGLSADKMGLTNAVLALSMSRVSETPSYPMPNIPKTPNFHQLPGPTSQGIDLLTVASLSLEPFAHPVDIPNLWVMPSGPLPPNPPELLDSKAMHHFFTTIADGGFEVIIFDTPPLLGLSDASILAPKVDGALVVVDIMRATKGKLKQMKAVLAAANVHVLGSIANKQRRSRSDAVYSNYYYYHVEEQNGQEKHASNSHRPTNHSVPVPQVSLAPLEQKKTSD